MGNTDLLLPSLIKHDYTILFSVICKQTLKLTDTTYLNISKRRLDNDSSPNHLTSLTQNPNQLHVIALGTFGGIFGAICSQVLLALLSGSDPHPAFYTKVFEIDKKCPNRNQRLMPHKSKLLLLV